MGLYFSLDQLQVGMLFPYESNVTHALTPFLLLVLVVDGWQKLAGNSSYDGSSILVGRGALVGFGAMCHLGSGLWKFRQGIGFQVSPR